MGKLVSIVTPCYNGEKYVGRFLESVLSQTYDNIEVILVNDGSTDRSESIILAYVGRFEEKGYKFVYIKQQNAGQSAAVNRGLRIFRGEYLMWPDSDDVLSPDHVRLKVNFLKKNPRFGLVRCRSVLVSETDWSRPLDIIGDDLLKCSSVCEGIISGKVHVMSGSWMVRRSALLHVLPSRTILAPREIGQNFQLLIPLTYRYACGYIKDILYAYVLHPSSHSHQPISYERELCKYVVAKDILCKIVKSMRISEESFYINRIIERRYRRWIMEVAAKRNDYKRIREEMQILRAAGLLTFSDRIIWWKYRYGWLKILIHGTAKISKVCKRLWYRRYCCWVERAY